MMDVRAEVGEVVQSKVCSGIVRDFYEFADGKANEHIWTLTDPGGVVKTSGSVESVSPPRFSGEELVLFEIHNHANPKGPAQAFLHLSDIGASFNSTNRVFGVYCVLVYAPARPYVVASKFDGDCIETLLRGDNGPLRMLYERLDTIHGDEVEGRRFQRRLGKTSTIAEMTDVYCATLPMLSFAVFAIQEGGLCPMYRP